MFSWLSMENCIWTLRTQEIFHFRAFDSERRQLNTSELRRRFCFTTSAGIPKTCNKRSSLAIHMEAPVWRSRKNATRDPFPLHSKETTLQREVSDNVLCKEGRGRITTLLKREIKCQYAPLSRKSLPHCWQWATWPH